MTLRCAARNSASARPLALCRSIRIGSVLVPRSTSHESNGPRIAPSAFCTNVSHSMSSSRVATTTPPTLSLWPFRYFVVLCITRSAPNSIGRWRYGLANVLSTTSGRSWRLASSLAAARSVRRMIGLVGVSTNSIRVADVIAALDGVQIGRVHVGKRQLVAGQHLVEEAERAAVDVVGDDHVIAGLEHRADRADGGHARGEGERRLAAFDGRDVALEREPRRVLRAGVLEALVLAERVLHVGRRLIDRRDDGAGRRVGLLAGVEADRAETRVSGELHDPATITFIC